MHTNMNATCISRTSAKDLGGLLNVQRAAFRRNPPAPVERITALRALEESLLERQDEAVDAVSRDFGGRAAEETLALELFPLLKEIKQARRRLRKWTAPQPVKLQWPFRPARARVQY